MRLKTSQFSALFTLAIAVPESYIRKKAHTPLQSQTQLHFYCAVRVSPPVLQTLCRLHCLKWNWEILQSPFLLLFPPKTPLGAFGFKKA